MSNQRFDFGLSGFVRVTPTNSPVTGGPFYALKAMGGDATFAAGCEVASGREAPASGDVLLGGDVLPGLFTSVSVSAGLLYAFPANKAPE